jgi:hypothetical protein
MKTKFVLAAIFVALATMGFDCINDPILVSLNIDPFSACYDINPGPNTSYQGSVVIDPNDLIDDSYKDKVADARVYNITVQVRGAFAGSVTGGQVTINGIPLLTYSGTWANFSTPQSLLGSSPYIHPQLAGIVELVRALKAKPLQPVTLASTGSLTGGGVPPVPSGLSVCVNVYAQADANVKQ